jgi:hypothetical protein
MTSEQAQPRWVFETVDPGKSGSSGKITDLFRNEADEARGLFKDAAPSYAATLMAREVIQNSWDAAAELQRDHADVQAFAIDFEFVSLEGSERSSFEQALDFAGLRGRVADLAADSDPRERLGLVSDDCLTSGDGDAGLQVCRIVEHGAVGMYGPWHGADSRMYLAMLSIGYNEKADGSGGTFGYGKSGLIRASRPRVILAYSCFRERENDPGVTRRLLGVTYWGQYSFGGESFNGFARFGQELDDGSVAPLCNDDADRVAESLGLSIRDAKNAETLGTTFLVIDPIVEAHDLREAIERNWWPAILDGRFVIQVVDRDGVEHHCRPRSNDRLDSFVDAYGVALGGEPTDNQRRIPLGTYHPHGGDKLDLGTLALTADATGWSFPNDGEATAVEDRSLIALMREPRMIVEYHLPGEQIAKRTPFVRGVYVASPELNVHLARTEPKGHERWETRPADEVPDESIRVAKEVLNRIKARVTAFQEELRPEVDTSRSVRLPRFDDRLKQLQRRAGIAPPSPTRGDRVLELRPAETSREFEGEGVTIRGHVDARLRQDRELEVSEVTLRFALALDEDGRRGDVIPLALMVPGARVVHRPTGTYVTLSITKEWTRFKIQSDVYRADWTSRLLVKRVDDAPELTKADG